MPLPIVLLLLLSLLWRTDTLEVAGHSNLSFLPQQTATCQDLQVRCCEQALSCCVAGHETCEHSPQMLAMHRERLRARLLCLSQIGA